MAVKTSVNLSTPQRCIPDQGPPCTAQILAQAQKRAARNGISPSRAIHRNLSAVLSLYASVFGRMNPMKIRRTPASASAPPKTAKAASLSIIHSDSMPLPVNFQQRTKRTLPLTRAKHRRTHIIDRSFLASEFRFRTKIALPIATPAPNLLMNQRPEAGALWLATCTVPSRSHLVQKPVKGDL